MAICRALCQGGSAGLVGGSTEGWALVCSWVSLARAGSAQGLLAATATSLAGQLEHQSFLVQDHLTLADVAVYHALRIARVSSVPPEVYRWCMSVEASIQGAFAAAAVAQPPTLGGFTAAPLESRPLPFPLKRAGALGLSKAKQPPSKGAETKAAEAPGEGQPVQKKKKEKKEKKEKKPKAPAAAPAAEDAPPVTKLDMRVGKILKAWKHEDSEKLWCEEIDIGEDKPRLIASGLRQFYADEADLTGRKVLVLANLKARNLGGFKSEGMVLCASNDAHDVVKFVEVPAEAEPGERVTFEGMEGPPATPAQVQKKKVLETVLPDLVTGDAGVCTYKGSPFLLKGGSCTAPVDAGFHIS